MNYRHVFHAGSFADVFKHALMTRALDYLMRKDAPLRYLDTHAGAGLYKIGSSDAQRTGEWRDGAARLLDAHMPAPVSALLGPYIRAAGLASDKARSHYPGSPLIAQRLLRSQDRLSLCELHEADARALTTALGRDRRVKAIHIDGYMALNAWVPPVERRGLVLIDPPFEAPDEFITLTDALVAAWRKWPSGTYMVWYPRKDLVTVARFHKKLAASGIERMLAIDCDVACVTADGPLAGSGLIVVNPPFTLEAEARVLLPYLTGLLAQGAGAGWRLDWLAQA